MAGNEPHPVDKFLCSLSDEDRMELERVVVHQDAKLWIEHQQKMFELKLWAAVVVVILVVFVLAFGLSTFGHTPDKWFLNMMQTVLVSTLGSAGAQAAISALMKKRAKPAITKATGELEKKK